MKQWPLKPCQVHFQGGDCSAAADFSHAAGVVNVAICPSQPAAAVLVPPVQDVYGDPGDAKFRLYGLPVGPSAAFWDAAGQAWLCQDTPSRSPGAGFESRFVVGVESSVELLLKRPYRTQADAARYQTMMTLGSGGLGLYASLADS